MAVEPPCVLSNALTRVTPTMRRSPRRLEPLRAERRRPSRRSLETMSLDEIFAEIEQRASSAAAGRRHLPPRLTPRHRSANRV